MKKIKFVILALISVIVSFFIGIGTFSNIENEVLNVLLRNSGTITNDVVIIGIDNESINKIGRFPWDRKTYATLIDNLVEGDVAVVGLDILFSETQTENDSDYVLSESIKNSNGKVLLATYGQLTENLNENDELVADFFYYPNEILLEGSPNVGFVNTLFDNNIIGRAIPYIYNNATESYETSFNYELYKIYAKSNNHNIIQLDKSYFARPYINYYGGVGSIETIPFYQAVDKEQISPEYFRNKIVLVGMTASGGEDVYQTPNGAMFGVEIHANFINNLLANNHKEVLINSNLKFISNNTHIDLTLFFIILIISLLQAYIIAKNKSSLKTAIICIGTLAVYILTAIAVFKFGYIVYFAYPVIVFLILYIVNIIIDFAIAQREKKKITDIFGRYMSKELVEKVVSEGVENIKLGGIKKDITVMFIDIRGFTTMSEQLQPEEVVDILNDYLTMSTEKIFKHKGVLDKYIGDGLMALFNTPYDIENPELMCIKSAMEIKENAEILHDKLYKKYNKSVRFGIGINCGDAIIGNVGSESRMDYTAIGDTINTAARLESNAKAGQILISDVLYERVKDKVKVEVVGELALKGKEKNILTYEVVEIL